MDRRFSNFWDYGRSVRLLSYTASRSLILLGQSREEPWWRDLESPIPVRCNAMAALARMRSRRTVEHLVAILGNEEEPAPVSKQALGALQNITGVPLRSAKVVKKWWKDFGKKRYENAPPIRPLPAAESKPRKSGPGARAPERKPMPKDDPPRKKFSGVTMGGED